MKARAIMAVLAATLIAAGCSARPEPSPVTPPATPPPATSSATTPVPTPTPAPEPVTAPTTTKPTTKPKASTRPAPTAGYQCRDGDEKRYEVCAGHKAWVDGQVEFANCARNGGTWNIPKQKCTYPAKTKAPSPPGVSSSDPNFRDANGETRAEYCARTGQPVNNCDAG